MTSLLQKIKALTTTVDTKQDEITPDSLIEVLNITSNINLIDNINPNNYNTLTYTSLKYIEDSINSFVSQIGDLTTTKQDSLTAGDNITIDENNRISASGVSFVGFRVEMSQEVDLNVGINATIPFNAKTGNSGGFVYDTHNMFNTTTYTYTIPTGYSGYWTFNMKLFVAEYGETFRRIHLRVTRGTINYDPLQIGNYYSQVDILNGTIPVLEGDIIRVFVSNGGSVRIFASRDNCWFEGRYIAPL